MNPLDKSNFRQMLLDSPNQYKIGFAIADVWGLARASSNTPTLVLRFESKTEEGLEKVKKLFKEKLDRHEKVSKEWDSTGH